MNGNRCEKLDDGEDDYVDDDDHFTDAAVAAIWWAQRDWVASGWLAGSASEEQATSVMVEEEEVDKSILSRLSWHIERMPMVAPNNIFFCTFHFFVFYE